MRVAVAESSPGERASVAWFFGGAFLKVVGMFAELAPSGPAGNALGVVPVVAAAAAENFVAVGLEVRGHWRFRFATLLT